MQNSYYNDNWQPRGLSLTLKTPLQLRLRPLCAPIFARAHEPPRDQPMYNIISVFFLAVSIPLSLPCSLPCLLRTLSPSLSLTCPWIFLSSRRVFFLTFFMVFYDLVHFCPLCFCLCLLVISPQPPPFVTSRFIRFEPLSSTGVSGFVAFFMYIYISFLFLFFFFTQESMGFCWI